MEKYIWEISQTKELLQKAREKGSELQEEYNRVSFEEANKSIIETEQKKGAVSDLYTKTKNELIKPNFIPVINDFMALMENVLNSLNKLKNFEAESIIADIEQKIKKIYQQANNTVNPNWKFDYRQGFLNEDITDWHFMAMDRSNPDIELFTIGREVKENGTTDFFIELNESRVSELNEDMIIELKTQLDKYLDGIKEKIWYVCKDAYDRRYVTCKSNFEGNAGTYRNIQKKIESDSFSKEVYNELNVDDTLNYKFPNEKFSADELFEKITNNSDVSHFPDYDMLKNPFDIMIRFADDILKTDENIRQDILFLNKVRDTIYAKERNVFIQDIKRSILFDIVPTVTDIISHSMSVFKSIKPDMCLFEILDKIDNVFFEVQRIRADDIVKNGTTKIKGEWSIDYEKYHNNEDYDDAYCVEYHFQYNGQPCDLIRLGGMITEDNGDIGNWEIKDRTSFGSISCFFTTKGSDYIINEMKKSTDFFKETAYKYLYECLQTELDSVNRTNDMIQKEIDRIKDKGELDR